MGHHDANPWYTLFRRDRSGRRGSSVNTSIASCLWRRGQVPATQYCSSYCKYKLTLELVAWLLERYTTTPPQLLYQTSELWASQPHRGLCWRYSVSLSNLFGDTGWRVQYCTGRLCCSLECTLLRCRPAKLFPPIPNKPFPFPGQTNLIGYMSASQARLPSRSGRQRVKVIIKPSSHIRDHHSRQQTRPGHRWCSPNQHTLFLSHPSSLDITTDTKLNQIKSNQQLI